MTLVIRDWTQISVKAIEALVLVQQARPVWLALAAVAVLTGFLCAGQIYGRVLATLGFRAPPLWLSAAAMVTTRTSWVMAATFAPPARS